MAARLSERVCAVVEASATPGRNPLLPPLAAELGRRRIELVVWDPTESLDLPPHMPEADLYLLKADDPLAIAAGACVHDAGARCLNSYPATAAARDKARMHALLAERGLPVPESRLVGSRRALEEALADGPRFVKPVQGAHGVGAHLLRAGEAARAGSGPWLVEQPVAGSSDDVLKVYGVDGRAAVRRMRFRPGVVDAPREVVEDVDPVVLDVACAAAEAAELVCWGADFVVGDDGPVLVDLNPFPGYRTVDEAPAWLADAIEEALA
jgi:ribosomal protein S6--L-glutamate ligase